MVRIGRRKTKLSPEAKDVRNRVIEAIKANRRPEVDDVPREVLDEAFGPITDFKAAHKFLLLFNDLLKAATNNRLMAQFSDSNKKEDESTFAYLGLAIEIRSVRGMKKLMYAPENPARKFFWGH